MAGVTFRYPRNLAPNDWLGSLNANGQPQDGHAGTWALVKSPWLRPIPDWSLFERSNAVRSTEVTRVPARASRNWLTPLLKVLVPWGKSADGLVEIAEVEHRPGPGTSTAGAAGPELIATGAGCALAAPAARISAAAARCNARGVRRIDAHTARSWTYSLRRE